MDKNIATITKFYTAFQQLDAKTMNSCYSDDIVFNDPAFGLLDAIQTKNMWHMLCSRAKDFSLEFGPIKTDDNEYYITNWVASYTFNITGKKVVNRIKAYMRLEDGVIIEHSDAFSFHKWASQALGFPGWLLGWNSFFQRSIRNKALKGLHQFIEKH
jgi:ketosteroid isomerase-like protein